MISPKPERSSARGLTKPTQVNKWLRGWRIMVDYGQGYEYACFELTWKETLANLKAYREACPEYPVKSQRGREMNPTWTTQRIKQVVAQAVREDYYLSAGEIADKYLPEIKGEDREVMASKALSDIRHRYMREDHLAGASK